MMNLSLRRRRQRGQSTMEFVLTYSALILPVSMMIIFTAKLLWVWNSMVDFTREGARYATTHCWQGDGGNVRSWMQQNAPLMFDRDQFQQGPAVFEIEYLGRNADTGELEEFACEGGECSRACIPDAVRVRVTGYEFRPFFGYLGLAPLPMPNFETTLAMESAGCNADSEECLP